MKTNDTLQRISDRINPVPSDAFENLAGSTDGRAVLAAILESTRAGEVSRRTGSRPAGPFVAKRGSRPRSVGIAAALAAATLVVGLVMIRPADPPRGADVAWDAELVRIAEESPRFLVGQTGWTVTRADEFDAMAGEMTFENGRYSVDLFWTPASTYSALVEDRRRAASASWRITIVGEPALLLQRKGVTPQGTSTLTALWLEGEHSMELRSDVIPTVDEFEGVAATLHYVDVDTWLSAMPQSVVKPDGRENAVDKILADIPVPTSVDPDELKQPGTVSAESSLRYEVTQAIVCGWVQQWVDAKGSGDEAAMQEAADALAGARDWRAFRERSQGTTYIFQVADAMATGSPLYEDSSLPVGVQYQRHIGCPEG